MPRARAWLPLAAVLLSVPATANAGGDRWIASVSTATLHTPDHTGALDHFASGGALTISWFERCRSTRMCGAIESSALFLSGADDRRFYDLALSLIASMPLNDERSFAPFLGVGFDVAANSIPENDGTSRGLSMGVHGNLGLHALVGERLYARAQVGYVGAGLGGIKGELALGLRFE